MSCVLFRVEFLSIISRMIRKLIPDLHEDQILELTENVKYLEIMVRFCKTLMDRRFGKNDTIKRKLKGVENKVFNPASVTVADKGVLILFFQNYKRFKRYMVIVVLEVQFCNILFG